MSHLPKQKLLANLSECGIIAQMRSDTLGKIPLALGCGGVIVSS